MNFIQNLDNKILIFFYKLTSENILIRNTFKLITFLGDNSFIWIVFTLVFLVKKRTRKLGVTLFISIITSFTFSSLILKQIFKRNRPFIILQLTPILNISGFSFPSTHSLISFCCATIIFSFNKKLGYYIYILAFLIAISRLFLCVHYFTDIFIGSIIGIITAKIILNLLNLFYKRLEKFNK